MSATVKPVARHECTLRDVPGSGFRHTSGMGRPKRKRCTCGGMLLVRTGFYAVFEWRGDGRYPDAAALGLFRSDEAAGARALLLGGNSHCVRWVDSGVPQGWAVAETSV